MAVRLMPAACQRLFRKPVTETIIGATYSLIGNAVRPVAPARRVLAVRNMTQVPPRKLAVLAESTLQSESVVGKRLDHVVSELFPSRYSSASGAKKAIRRKEIHVNGAVGRTDLTVSKGDVVQVVVKVGNAAAWPSSQGKPGLDVAYEDDHLACIVKPQGLPTQGKGENTVQGRVKYCLQPSPLPGALFRPHHVHRLDVNTGGLLLVAKTREGTTMAVDLAAHNMQKRYLALVLGRLEGSGIIDFPLERKPAITLFRTESHSASESFGWLTCVSLWPKTGRTHQLRKHCAYIGHPILGDMQYKRHRKAGCQPQQVPDVQQYLPQLTDLAAAAAAAAAGPSAGDASLRQSVSQKHHWAGDSQATAAGGTATGLSAAVPQQSEHQRLQEMQLHHAPQLKRQKQQHDGLIVQPAAGLVQSCNQQDLHALNPGLMDDSASPVVMPDQEMVSIIRAEGDEMDDSVTAAAQAAGPDAASGTGAQHTGGCRQQGQQLKDGSIVKTCLWAVQLHLLHPVTRQPLDLNIQQQAEHLYRQICAAEAPQQAGQKLVQPQQQQRHQ